jgi:hypothetical protein
MEETFVFLPWLEPRNSHSTAGLGSGRKDICTLCFGTKVHMALRGTSQQEGAPGVWGDAAERTRSLQPYVIAYHKSSTVYVQINVGDPGYIKSNTQKVRLTYQHLRMYIYINIKTHYMFRPSKGHDQVLRVTS